MIKVRIVEGQIEKEGQIAHCAFEDMYSTPRCAAYNEQEIMKHKQEYNKETQKVDPVPDSEYKCIISTCSRGDFAIGEFKDDSKI